MAIEQRWNPPRETGLTETKYLIEEIAQHVDDISDSRAPGVYVLELSTLDTNSIEEHSRAWLEHFETIPEYLNTIAGSDRLLYVGASPDVQSRIETHLHSPNRSTTIAKVYPIHSIESIYWMNSAEEAFTKESKIAIDLANEYPDAYVHSR